MPDKQIAKVRSLLDEAEFVDAKKIHIQLIDYNWAMAMMESLTKTFNYVNLAPGKRRLKRTKKS